MDKNLSYREAEKVLEQIPFSAISFSSNKEIIELKIKQIQLLAVVSTFLALYGGAFYKIKDKIDFSSELFFWYSVAGYLLFVFNVFFKLSEAQELIKGASIHDIGYVSLLVKYSPLRVAFSIIYKHFVNNKFVFIGAYILRTLFVFSVYVVTLFVVFQIVKHL